MNASELHALVEPIRAAMIRDKAWPEREGRVLVCDPDWRWIRDLMTAPSSRMTSVAVHPDDAANAITVALLVEAVDTGQIECVPWSKHQDQLPALVAWYKQKKGLAQ